MLIFTFKFDKEHSQNIQHFLYSSSTVCSALWIAQEYFNDWATNLNHLELQQFIYIWCYPNTESKLYNVDFVRDRTEGFDNFIKEIERQDVDQLAKVAGVDKQLVKEAAIAYAMQCTYILFKFSPQ